MGIPTGSAVISLCRPPGQPGREASQAFFIHAVNIYTIDENLVAAVIYSCKFRKENICMEMIALDKELKENSYPGRGIIIGRSADGTKAVTAYFIMGRSENSRNRVFVEDGEGIRTQAFDPSKLVDPSLIIYAPVRATWK